MSMAVQQAGMDADTDALAGPRDAVAEAIAKLRGFNGTAGSDDMRRVQCALDQIGYAYSILTQRDDNPAWSDA